MRSILVFLVFLGFVYANSFVSLHDGRFLSTLLNNKQFLEGKKSAAFNKEFYLMQHTKKMDQTGELYYPQGWLRFKFYVPAGTFVKLVLSSFPNTSMRIDLKFKGDNNNILDHVSPQPKSFVIKPSDDPLYFTDQPTIKNIAINTFNQIGYNLDEGGWVYVSIVENSAEIRGDNGYIEQSRLVVNYRVEMIDGEKFKNWLFDTTFLEEGGDPVDAVDELTERDKTLKEGKIVTVVKKLSLKDVGEYQLDPGIDIYHTMIKTPAANYTQQSNEEEESVIVEQQIDTTEENMVLNEDLSEIEKQILSKKFPIDGYFVRINKEKNVWIYVSKKTKSIYKFNGIKEDGEVDWTKLPNLYPVISNSSIKFVLPSQTYQEISSDEDSSSSQKECPGGYYYDANDGICQPLQANGEQSINNSNDFVSQNTGGTSALPSPETSSQQSSSSAKSCLEGYHYDPEVGYCVQ